MSRLRVTPDIAGAKEPRGPCLAGFFCENAPRIRQWITAFTGQFWPIRGSSQPNLGHILVTT
jgi:hypothetical protein